jgi:hypothetical protein
MSMVSSIMDSDVRFCEWLAKCSPAHRDIIMSTVEDFGDEWPDGQMIGKKREPDLQKYFMAGKLFNKTLFEFFNVMVHNGVPVDKFTELCLVAGQLNDDRKKELVTALHKFKAGVWCNKDGTPFEVYTVPWRLVSASAYGKYSLSNREATLRKMQNAKVIGGTIFPHKHGGFYADGTSIAGGNFIDKEHNFSQMTKGGGEDPDGRVDAALLMLGTPLVPRPGTSHFTTTSSSRHTPWAEADLPRVDPNMHQDGVDMVHPLLLPASITELNEGDDIFMSTAEMCAEMDKMDFMSAAEEVSKITSRLSPIAEVSVPSTINCGRKRPFSVDELVEELLEFGMTPTYFTDITDKPMAVKKFKFHLASESPTEVELKTMYWSAI